MKTAVFSLGWSLLTATYPSVLGWVSPGKVPFLLSKSWWLTLWNHHPPFVEWKGWGQSPNHHSCHVYILWWCLCWICCWVWVSFWILRLFISSLLWYFLSVVTTSINRIVSWPWCCLTYILHLISIISLDSTEPYSTIKLRTHLQLQLMVKSQIKPNHKNTVLKANHTN